MKDFLEDLWDVIWYNSLFNWVRHKSEDVKYKWQTLTKGHNDLDKWSYCYTFLEREYKPFCAFYNHVKSNGFGHPGAFKSQKEWYKTLDEIKFAMDFFRKDKLEDGHYGNLLVNDNYTKWKKDCARAEKGMALYGKYLMTMWD